MPRLLLVTINGTTPDGGYATLDHGLNQAAEFLKPFVVSGYRGPIGLQCVGIPGDPGDNLTRSMKAWKQLSAQLNDVPESRRP